MQNPEPHRDQRSRGRQILFIILIYLLLTSNSSDNKQNSISQTKIIDKIKNPKALPPDLNQLFSLVERNQYVGTWSLDEKEDLKNQIFKHTNGKFKAYFSRFGNVTHSTHLITIDMNDGQYIDDGNVVMRMEVNHKKFESVRGEEMQAMVQITKNNISKEQNISVLFEHNLVLQTLQRKNMNISDFQMTFGYNQINGQIDISMKIIGKNISWRLNLTYINSNIIHILILAALLFIIAIMEFSAILAIYKDIMDGVESAGIYSVATMLVCTLWDASLSIFSFSQAFSSDQSLLLLIIPSFIFLFLFMNLELRFILMIFQARQNQDGNIRDMICKFNLVTYGSLILIYPALYFTNLSPYLFIGVSCLLIPQILNNGQNSVRPKLYSPFYRVFIPTRFLLFFYMKLYPWNLLELQPNYFLSILCLLILVGQYFLLWVQAVYGPRKVIPPFLLPKIYNYECEIEENVQEGIQMVSNQSDIQDQCAICLGPLNVVPPDVQLDFQVNYKVMKSPCGHRYHGPCLVKWMQIKMQCPQCRVQLPPFQ